MAKHEPTTKLQRDLLKAKRSIDEIKAVLAAAHYEVTGGGAMLSDLRRRPVITVQFTLSPMPTRRRHQDHGIYKRRQPARS